MYKWWRFCDRLVATSVCISCVVRLLFFYLYLFFGYPFLSLSFSYIFAAVDVRRIKLHIYLILPLRFPIDWDTFSCVVGHFAVAREHNSGISTSDADVKSDIITFFSGDITFHFISTFWPGLYGDVLLSYITHLFDICCFVWCIATDVIINRFKLRSLFLSNNYLFLSSVWTVLKFRC